MAEKVALLEPLKFDAIFPFSCANSLNVDSSVFNKYIKRFIAE